MSATTKTSILAQNRAELSRELFLKELEDFPAELRSAIWEGYRDRLARARGKPMLGEIAPWLLADLLPLDDRESAAQGLASISMHMYTYTLLMDDVLDQDNKRDAGLLLIGAGLLLQKGLSRIYTILPKEGRLKLFADRFFLESASAALRDFQRYRQGTREFPTTAVPNLGQKGALLKMCSVCLLAADSKNVDDSVLVPIEVLATGMQLLDDVTDWREDWESGNFTYLLSRTSRTLKRLRVERNFEPGNFAHTEALLALVLTGSLEDVLRKGVYYLGQVVAINPSERGNLAIDFLSGVLAETQSFADEVRDIRTMLEENRRAERVSVSQFLQRGPTDAVVRESVETVERRLRVVAQNT